MISDTMPLHEAVTWLKGQLTLGAKCPCCGQYAKIYKRTITPAMANGLNVLNMYRDNDTYVHVPSILARLGGDLAKLRHWKLVEEDPSRRGYWRTTEHGREFLAGKVTVRRYALLYNGTLWGLAGKDVSYHDTRNVTRSIDLTVTHR